MDYPDSGYVEGDRRRKSPFVYIAAYPIILQADTGEP